MDKKELATTVENMVKAVAENNKVNEQVARALVGSMLASVSDQIVAACKLPTLSLGAAS